MDDTPTSTSTPRGEEFVDKDLLDSSMSPDVNPSLELPSTDEFNERMTATSSTPEDLHRKNEFVNKDLLDSFTSPDVYPSLELPSEDASVESVSATSSTPKDLHRKYAFVNKDLLNSFMRPGNYRPSGLPVAVFSKGSTSTLPSIPEEDYVEKEPLGCSHSGNIVTISADSHKRSELTTAVLSKESTIRIPPEAEFQKGEEGSVNDSLGAIKYPGKTQRISTMPFEPSVAFLSKKEASMLPLASFKDQDVYPSLELPLTNTSVESVSATSSTPEDLQRKNEFVNKDLLDSFMCPGNYRPSGLPVAVFSKGSTSTLPSIPEEDYDEQEPLGCSHSGKIVTISADLRKRSELTTDVLLKESTLRIPPEEEFQKGEEGSVNDALGAIKHPGKTQRISTMPFELPVVFLSKEEASMLPLATFKYQEQIDKMFAEQLERFEAYKAVWPKEITSRPSSFMKDDYNQRNSGVDFKSFMNPGNVDRMTVLIHKPFDPPISVFGWGSSSAPPPIPKSGDEDKDSLDSFMIPVLYLNRDAEYGHRNIMKRTGGTIHSDSPDSYEYIQSGSKRRRRTTIHRKRLLNLWYKYAPTSTRSLKKLILILTGLMIILGILSCSAGAFKAYRQHTVNLYWDITAVAFVTVGLALIGLIGVCRPSIPMMKIFAVSSFVYGHLILSVVLVWYAYFTLMIYFSAEDIEKKLGLRLSDPYVRHYLKSLIILSIVTMSAGVTTTQLIMKASSSQGYVVTEMKR